jgi:hypothetical protein
MKIREVMVLFNAFLKGFVFCTIVGIVATGCAQVDFEKFNKRLPEPIAGRIRVSPSGAACIDADYEEYVAGYYTGKHKHLSYSNYLGNDSVSSPEYTIATHVATTDGIEAVPNDDIVLASESKNEIESNFVWQVTSTYRLVPSEEKIGLYR